MPDWKFEIRKRLPAGLEPTRESEVVDELAQHLQDRFAELVTSGVNDKDARHTVLSELDDGEQLGKDLLRSVRSSREPLVPGADKSERWFTGIGRDFRFAIRSLRSSPGFVVVAIISLALGIGANTAIFQLIDAVRLRALPVRNPSELAIIRVANTNWAQGRFMGDFPRMTGPLWEQIKQRQQAFSGVFAFGNQTFNLSNGGEARVARALWLSGDAFNVLGVQAVAGRLFTDLDDQRGCGSPGVVLNYAFWQREFGGDASAIGRKLALDGHPLEIIGVTPPGFFGLNIGRNFDVALPLCADPLLNGQEAMRQDSRWTWWLGVMGRLKPGWDLEKASAQLSSISPAAIEDTIPPQYNPESVAKYRSMRLGAFPGAGGISNLRSDYADPLYMLLAVVALVLLIACANLANLLLARGTAREREIAIRLALGASRTRLIRQFLAESLLLAFAGALAGLFLAQNASAFLVRFISTENRPIFVDLGLDWRVFAFTAGLTVVTCLLFGLVPALRTTRLSPNAVMTSGGRGMTSNRERFGLRRILVVSQVALSLVLLVGALLFVRSLGKLLKVDAGFQTSGILITEVDYSTLQLPATKRREFQNEMLERVRNTPGLESAATTSISPMSGSGWNQDVVVGTDKKDAYLTRVSQGYFKTLGTTMIHGRDFERHDNTSSAPVAIVNEQFVRTFMPGQDPVGRTFHLEVARGEPQITYEIIGLVKNTKYYELREDAYPIAFFSEEQDLTPDPNVDLITNSSLPMQETTARVKKVMETVDPRISLRFHLFDTRIREGLLRERLMATLSAGFGFLAVALAMVGLYGVISYMVVRRTNEIGIRMALGADRRRILNMVMTEAATLLGIGLFLGLGISLVATRAATALLFGLKPHDPLTLALACFGLAAISVTASFLPARRASSLDPMVALRQE